ncbi:hypothetical protein KCH_18820 [Kitasatospora cheerisanensis KCTC 2395]|uniref:Uncharacterized protein n=1 Tax=Kitasatospora cheerisanensis KCTC 2395 TaxID=1348663 RepID=A0A066Z7A3_9ACTN|nr:hypothetical protein KCH_18820 [Kitasatospora cheerisanensis KCTC 2395]
MAGESHRGWCSGLGGRVLPLPPGGACTAGATSVRFSHRLLRRTSGRPRR